MGCRLHLVRQRRTLDLFGSLGLQVNDHVVEPGDVLFRPCQLGVEGIVSKRLGSPYRSGRSRHWVKSKNQQHPAVKREAEEDWGEGRCAGASVVAVV
jgi:hypothetical protein